MLMFCFNLGEKSWENCRKRTIFLKELWVVDNISQSEGHLGMPSQSNRVERCFLGLFSYGKSTRILIRPQALPMLGRKANVWRMPSPNRMQIRAYHFCTCDLPAAMHSKAHNFSAFLTTRQLKGCPFLWL